MAVVAPNPPVAPCPAPNPTATGWRTSCRRAVQARRRHDRDGQPPPGGRGQAGPPGLRHRRGRLPAAGSDGSGRRRGHPGRRVGRARPPRVAVPRRRHGRGRHPPQRRERQRPLGQPARPSSPATSCWPRRRRSPRRSAPRWPACWPPPSAGCARARSASCSDAYDVDRTEAAYLRVDRAARRRRCSPPPAASAASSADLPRADIDRADRVRPGATAWRSRSSTTSSTWSPPTSSSASPPATTSSRASTPCPTLRALAGPQGDELRSTARCPHRGRGVDPCPGPGAPGRRRRHLHRHRPRVRRDRVRPARPVRGGRASAWCETHGSRSAPRSWPATGRRWPRARPRAAPRRSARPPRASPVWSPRPAASRTACCRASDSRRAPRRGPAASSWPSTGGSPDGPAASWSPAAAGGGGPVLATSKPVPGKPVHTTIDPALQQAAVAALGGQYGGVAVLDARNGSVLALAGIAFSGPQPPGSTFKLITTTAALEAGVVKLTRPVPDPDLDRGRRPRGRQRPQRSLRRELRRGLRGVVQQRLRPARAEGRLGAARGRGGALRLQLAAQPVRPAGDSDRGPAPEHDPDLDPRTPSTSG